MVLRVEVSNMVGAALKDKLLLLVTEIHKSIINAAKEGSFISTTCISPDSPAYPSIRAHDSVTALLKLIFLEEGVELDILFNSDKQYTIVAKSDIYTTCSLPGYLEQIYGHKDNL